MLFFLTKFLLKILLLIAGVKVAVEGLENIPRGQGLILAANHPGFIDFMVHYSIVPYPFRFVVAYTFFKMPLMRGLAKRLGFIPVGEEKQRKIVMSQSGLAKFSALKRREMIFVFPEGQRKKEPGEAMAKFRTWAARIAQATGAPVVPIAVKGTEYILSKMRFLLYPGRAQVSVGKPFYLSRDISAEEATAILQEKIDSLYRTL